MELVDVPVAETKNKKQFRDGFQLNFGRKVDEYSKKLDGQGRNILYGIGALCVLGIVAWLFMSWSARSNAAAQTALGKAIETSQAQISELPAPAGSTVKVFKTEKERAEASITAFQGVAEKFGGAVGEKAKYFVAVNQLSVDREAALASLDSLAKAGGETGTMAKFALANANVDGNKLDEAAALYKELAAMSDSIYSKDTINFELAKIYEKQGKKQEAVDLLFGMVKTASEAKDADGKPVPLTSTVESAKSKLEELDPAKAKEIPVNEPESPFGAAPVG